MLKGDKANTEGVLIFSLFFSNVCGPVGYQKEYIKVRYKMYEIIIIIIIIIISSEKRHRSNV